MITMKTQATNEQVGQSFYLNVSSQIDNLKLMTVVWKWQQQQQPQVYGLQTAVLVQMCFWGIFFFPKDSRAKEHDKCVYNINVCIVLIHKSNNNNEIK